MPSSPGTKWRIEELDFSQPAVKLLKSQQRETNCRQKTAGLTRVEVGAGSRDFLWEPGGADKALQPTENKIINWLGFNGVHYLWVQTLGWEEIYTLVISNLSSAAWNNRPGLTENSQWRSQPGWHLWGVEKSHSGWRRTAGLKSVYTLRVTN